MHNNSNNHFICLLGVGLWPNMPQKKAGMRMLPPISEPIPMTDPADPIKAPSPPKF